MSVEIGQIISHYQIVEKLGEGGMGVVYKARDTALNRFVALKFIPHHLTQDEATRKRFQVEAQAASALDHPNICTIHEINETPDGQLFICMAYYPGESLRKKMKDGPIPLDEAAEILVQISQGLKTAHEQKIIHRDIKPGNILITPKGDIKIVDFGLAKLSGMEISRSTSSKGTAAYMCPEQIRGQKVDHRCDIWALGIVFYEMLTGQLPFEGDYPEPMMYAIVNEEAKSLSQFLSDVPELLQSIIDKLLKKNPAERYQNFSEIRVDLELLATKNGSDRVKTRSNISKRLRQKKIYLYSIYTILTAVLFFMIGRLYLFPEQSKANLIVVLPMESIAGDAGQEWFSDGMTDALITDLAQISGLHVISRSTAMKYKGTKKAPPDIAAELGVHYVIEASAVKSADQVKIAARLINASDDQYIWAKNYDREFKNMPVLFSEVAQEIAREIKAEITPQEYERFTVVKPVNPEAYELYLKGMYHFNKLFKEDIKKAIEYFKKSIQVDSSFANPYAALNYCYGMFTYSGEIPREEGIQKIRISINKALELDKNLAEAYQGLGALRLWQLWDWNGAGEAFSHALALNPNLSGINGTEYAWYLICMGQKTEAITEARRLLQLDPLSYVTRMTVNYVYYCAGRYQEAIKLCQRTIELEPQNPEVYEDLARNYEQLSKHDEAHKYRLSSLKISGTAAEAISAYDSLYKRLGSKAYPTWLLMNQEKLAGLSIFITPFCHTAWIYTRLGDNDKALSFLEKAYENKEGELATLKIDPKWDSLRDEPKFKDLLKRMHFPD